MVWHQVRTLISRQSRDMARPLRWVGAQASRAEHGSCGTRDPSFTYKKHAQDDPERLTCNTCGFVVYENPLIVAGSVPVLRNPATGDTAVLLCRRAIPPRVGFWNLPAGYMEKGESLRQAAAREAKEEALADIEVSATPLALYDISHIGQVHIYYTSLLRSPSFEPGVESLEVRLFPWEEVPWAELAFPTVSWALMHHLQCEESRRTHQPHPPFSNPVLPGHEGSTNVWFCPDKGLYYDKTWRVKEELASK